MKRVLALLLMLVILSGMTTAAAAGAGTASDPLVSRSYADDIYAPVMRRNSINTVKNAVAAVETAATSELQGIYDSYMAHLGSVQGYTLSEGAELFRLRGGAGNVSGRLGTSFVLVSGGMTISFSSGTVLDLTTGETVTSGASLTEGHRYFCAEGTAAKIKATQHTYCLVDGYYSADPLGYIDVKKGAWYYNAVEYACFNNLFSGMSNTEFGPSVPMTRAMLVTVLYSMSGKPDVSGAANSFSDVASSAWYANAVKWASGSGIVAGYGNGRFGPADVVTRQQMAVILYRYAQKMGYDTSATADLTGYSDYGKIASWAREAMSWARGAGLISGMSATEISPQTAALRSQVAQILKNFCQTVALTTADPTMNTAAAQEAPATEAENAEAAESPAPSEAPAEEEPEATEEPETGEEPAETAAPEEPEASEEPGV